MHILLQNGSFGITDPLQLEFVQVSAQFFIHILKIGDSKHLKWPEKGLGNQL